MAVLIGSVTATGTSSVTPDFSSIPWQTGDIAVAVVGLNDNHAGWTVTTGYVERGVGVNSGASTPDRALSLFSKELAPGEDETPNFAAAGGVIYIGCLSVWRFLTETEVGNAGVGDDGGDGAVTPPITVTAAPAVVFSMYYRTESVNGPVVPPTGYTIVPSPRIEATAALMVATKEVAVTGLETPGAWDYNPVSGLWTHARLTVALESAPSPPATPGNPTATTQSATEILVGWDNVADETGFRVERSPNGTTGWADVSGNLAADTLSYLDTGLTCNTEYFYRVFAFNAVGDSSPSSVVSDTTSVCSAGGEAILRSARYGLTRLTR